MRLLLLISVLLITFNVIARPTPPILWEGYFTIILSENKVFFSIPDSILGRTILLYSRIINSSQNLRSSYNLHNGYPGAIATEKSIHFEKNKNEKIQLKTFDFQINVPITSGAIRHNTKKELPESMLFKSQNSGEFQSTIDVTDFILRENTFFHIGTMLKADLFKKTFPSPSITIVGIKTDSTTIEIRTKIIYDNNTFLELSTNMVLLDSTIMPFREADSSINYHSLPIFSNNDTINAITRHFLQPAEQDIERYLSGEMIEPKEQIIFYIDSSVPKKWIPYFIKGVNNWQKAFEKAGFKNAIIGKNVSEKVLDSTFSLFHGKNNVIHYINSDIKNAYYSTIVDPRSGEIIQSHILYSSAFTQELQNLYFVQASPSDPRARTPSFSDALIGEIITSIVSHEVGHCLGFTHNMLCSYNTPTHKLRDSKWLERNGICASIMDYARYNYVAQPKDKIQSARGLQWQIGEHDVYAIKWGYKAPINTSNNDGHQVSIKAKRRRYVFLPEGINDPRMQSEALGNNIVKSIRYGIKNLQFIISNSQFWTTPDTKESTQQTRYEYILKQYELYQSIVGANIGGTNYHFTRSKKIKSKPVPYHQQKKCLKFLITEYFNTPDWLYKNNSSALIKEKGITKVEQIQENALTILLDPRSDQLLCIKHNGKKTNAHYTQLRKGLWGKSTNKNLDSSRTKLQTTYLENMFRLLLSKPNNSNQILSKEDKKIIHQQLKILLATLKRNDTHQKFVYTVIQKLNIYEKQANH